MNRRQRVALLLGMALVLFSLGCPYTRFYPPSRFSQSGQSEVQAIWEELNAEPRNGFRPIWLTPDPLRIHRAAGFDWQGVHWSVVAAIVSGTAVLTFAGVAVLGGREWRRSTVAQLKGRLRFSVRGLMLAVVVVALSIQAVRLAGLSLHYHRQAVYYGEWLPRWPGSGTPQGEALAARQVEWAHALGRKYERAVLRPWVVVEPDPPMP